MRFATLGQMLTILRSFRDDCATVQRLIREIVFELVEWDGADLPGGRHLIIVDCAVEVHLRRSGRLSERHLATITATRSGVYEISIGAETYRIDSGAGDAVAWLMRQIAATKAGTDYPSSKAISRAQPPAPDQIRGLSQAPPPDSTV